MKIAIIRHTVRNRGSDNAFFNYANYLIQHGHEVFYYTNFRETNLAFNPAIRFQQVPYRGALGTIFFVSTNKFSEDIVAIDLVPLACLAWMRNRRKLVYLARGYDVSYFKFPAMRLAMRALYRLALHHLRIPVISVSDSLTKTLQQFLPYKILTAPNGVDTGFFQKTPGQRRFVKNAGETVILFHYRNEFVKGSDIGLKALEKLSESQKEGWVLWVIGEELPTQAGIKMVNYGFLDHEKLRDILSAADIFLLPSRSEGMSPLLLQALACACAVVATEASSILTHGEDALVAPIDDPLNMAANLKPLIDDRSLRNNHPRNAPLLAKDYSLEKRRRFEEALLSVHQAQKAKGSHQ